MVPSTRWSRPDVSDRTPDPEERYAHLVDELSLDPEVALAARSGFGAGSLCVRGKIFAMLVRGQLVVKLPRPRVDQLVARKEGDRFDANKGKPMKEWLAL